MLWIFCTYNWNAFGIKILLTKTVGILIYSSFNVPHHTPIQFRFKFRFYMQKSEKNVSVKCIKLFLLCGKTFFSISIEYRDFLRLKQKLWMGFVGRLVGESMKHCEPTKSNSTMHTIFLNFNEALSFWWTYIIRQLANVIFEFQWRNDNNRHKFKLQKKSLQKKYFRK